MKLVNCGYDVVNAIMEEISKKHIIFPNGKISLKKLEDITGYRVQLIGSAFDNHIKPELLKRDIEAKKAGSPVEIKLNHATKIIKEELSTNRPVPSHEDKL